MERVDILVVGGGLAGLAAAARLAADGAAVTVADAAPPKPVEAGAAGADLRTTAFLQPAIETLRRAGAWEGMREGAEPLWTMRLLDAGGRENRERERADFQSGEMGERPFGWNVPNTLARAALMARIEALGVRLRAPAALERLTLREDAAFARLSDGSSVRAGLVVAADGRDGATRRLAGIGARRWRYGQAALTFAVAHPSPHGGVSTEIHRTGGPFTLVPMPDREIDGAWRHASSVVWMERAAEADRLMGLDADAFAEALNARALGVLGRLEPVGGRAVWPMIAQIADRMAGRRVALVGEAAHVIPPIGAQGLNMSLGDAEALAERVDAARGTGTDSGAPALLEDYHRRRWPEIAARIAGVDALNRAALAEARPLRDLRRLGLAALHRVGPARRMAMRLGMGAE